MPSTGWLAAIAITAFLAGYGARSFGAWWRREEEREEEEFFHLFGSALTHLVAGRQTEAIDELSRAARIRSDVAGLYLILGDLYRDRGQFDRAIRIHHTLLARTDLSRAERAQTHTSLGEDYRQAGLSDRAREAYKLALELDSRSLQALKGLSKFEIDDGNWMEAAELDRSGHTLGFLLYEMGMDSLREDDEKAAMRAFRRSVAVSEHNYPSHLLIGDLHHKLGRPKKAREAWERVIEMKPRLLHLVYDRLEQVYAETGESDLLHSICLRLAERDPLDWRVRVFLALHENHRGNPDAAYRHLLDAARAHPCSITIHKELWKMTRERGLDPRVAQEMSGISKGPGPFVDPFICTTCRFRSQAYLWRCPQCHTWDTFADEPA
jgi:lipopolysaccharide biosynthesis regulator YciM